MPIFVGKLVALLLAIVAIVAIAPSARAEDTNAPITLDALLEAYRTMGGLEAKFREEKHIALLAEPLVSEGTLHYASPSKLARHTLTPTRQSVLLEGEELRFFDGTREEVVDLGANAGLRTFVTSFLRLLAGDRAALDRAFRIRFAAKGRGWTIALEPREGSVKRIVQRIELEGEELVLSRMRLVEASGDEARTTFSDVKPGRVYRDDELRRIFRGPRAR